MVTNDDELAREQAIAELRTLIPPLLVDRAAPRMTTAQLRRTVAAAHAQLEHYRAHGFVDEAAGA